MNTIGSVIRVGIGLTVGVALLAGCNTPYRGAVYSRYSHVGVRVKSDPKTAIPVAIDIGHDHATAAYIPKAIIARDSDGQVHAEGEVGSIISRFEVEANVPSPVKVPIDKGEVLLRRPGQGERARQILTELPEAGLTEEQKALRRILLAAETPGQPEATHAYKLDYENGSTVARARSYLIAGTAAVVASLPKGKSITIADGDTCYTIKPTTPASERISEALSSTPGRVYVVSNTGFAKRLRKWVADGEGSCGDVPSDEERSKIVNAIVRDNFGTDKIVENSGYYTCLRLNPEESEFVWRKLVKNKVICDGLAKRLRKWVADGEGSCGDVPSDEERSKIVNAIVRDNLGTDKIVENNGYYTCLRLNPEESEFVWRKLVKDKVVCE